MHGTRAIANTFRVAGALNVAGILIFTRGFTSDGLAAIDPAAFGTPGTLLIAAWGLAYWLAAEVPEPRRWISLAFVLEKAVYTVRWIDWTGGPRPAFAELWAADPLTAVFFAIYGPYDALWGAFFLWALVRTARARRRGK